ncbi:MAG: 50S ribosomal protein L25 [Planctomycetota bacterium]|nr:MAG: 50S ribosomal protein L25 [Planctomycetota bacterium]GDY09941.1 50S ribosomal protein L25 [Planctomycetia bacterium]
METKLVAQRRTKLGTSANRRLRASGQVPGNLYGHKQDPISVSFSTKEAAALVRSTHRVVDLELDGKSETAILRETQWDVFHKQLWHVDFMRVDANERVKVDVDVVLRGTAAGALAGGVLEHSLHMLHIDCLAINIPEAISVKVQGLQIGQAIHVKDLEIPVGVTVLNNPDAIVVRVVQPIVVEVAPSEAAVAEPEVIKKEKKAAEEDAKAGKK